MRFGLVCCCQANSHCYHQCFINSAHFCYLSIEKFVQGDLLFVVGPQVLSLVRSASWHRLSYLFALMTEWLGVTVELIRAIDLDPLRWQLTALVNLLKPAAGRSLHLDPPSFAQPP